MAANPATLIGSPKGSTRREREYSFGVAEVHWPSAAPTLEAPAMAAHALRNCLRCILDPEWRKRGLRRPESAQMRDRASSQRRQRVATLERGNDAALRVARRHGNDLRGYPGEVRVGELEIGQRIFAMRIEAGRDEQDFGPMRFECRQATIGEGGAEGGAAAARRQRHIVHVCTERLDARIRIKGILKRADHD